jgi:hypothetical protein
MRTVIHQRHRDGGEESGSRIDPHVTNVREAFVLGPRYTDHAAFRRRIVTGLRPAFNSMGRCVKTREDVSAAQKNATIGEVSDIEYLERGSAGQALPSTLAKKCSSASGRSPAEARQKSVNRVAKLPLRTARHVLR